MKDGGAEVAAGAGLVGDADDEDLDDDAIDAMEQAADEIEQEVLSEQECVTLENHSRLHKLTFDPVRVTTSVNLMRLDSMKLILKTISTIMQMVIEAGPVGTSFSEGGCPAELEVSHICIHSYRPFP